MWDFIIEFKIDYFRDYLKLINDSSKKEVEKVEEANQQLIADGVKPYYGEHGEVYDPFEYLADQLYQIDELKQLMLSTFVVGVFVFLEDRINTLCCRVEKIHETPFSYKDLKGNGVARSRKYLEKILKQKFPEDLNIRETLEVARIIRNSFVHADGIIEKGDRPRILKYAEKYPDMLKMNDNLGSVKITDKYAESLIDLLVNVHKEIKLHMKADSVFS